LIHSTWGENDDLPELPIRDYRAILALLDSAPISQREYIGGWIAEQHRKLRLVRHRVSGNVLLSQTLLVYICDYEENCPDKKQWLGQLFGLAALRALEWREQKHRFSPILAVAVRVMSGGAPEYSYFFLSEPIPLGRDLRSSIEWSFGVASFSASRVRKPDVGRNKKCPCGSGLKYKRCHGGVNPPTELF
jgi:hypothetical protein